MTERNDQSTYDAAEDDSLQEELGALLGRVDPVPERVVEAGRSAYTWRSIDEELAELAALAELTHDSLLEDDVALAGVRGSAGLRTVIFESPVLTVELEVTGIGGEQRRLVGQLVPPSRAGILVEHRAADLSGATGVADELGRFVIDAVAAGDVRLHFSLADGSEVRTGWTQL